MTSSEKQCKKCNEIKPLSEFNKQSKSKDGLQVYCRSCQSEIGKDWAKQNPDRNLLQRYGITGEYKANMAQSQGDCCAICRIPFSDVLSPCVDHCHESTKIRGILCHHCNTGLGLFKDSPKLLQQAIYYLDYHAQKIATSSVPTGDHQQGEDDPQHGLVFATRTGEDDDNPHHHCGTISREDLDHRAQESSGNRVGYGVQKVGTLEVFTRIEDYGKSDAEIIRLEFGRRDLFD
jgi:hypothetical protein